MIRVMVVARLFSGLADGLAQEAWRPHGVPAIYRLLESLAARKDVELLTVFANKDDNGGRFARGREFETPSLGRVVILPWVPRNWLAALGLDGKLREAGHLLRCLWLWLRFRPHLVYATNANFPVAAIFARLRLSRVVLRLLGLHPDQYRVAESRGGFQRWLYHAPFDHVVCSLDGSGVDYYLPRLIAPQVPCSVLLNGVDPQRPDIEATARIEKSHGEDGPPVVLFIGRLEWNKGCREFVEGVLGLLARRPGSLRAVLVGDGGLRVELAGRIAAARAEDQVLLAGNVPHGEVAAWLARADVYVSLNHLGNLSNANLEAMAAGKCMIILDADPKTHTDMETARLIPGDAAMRIGREEMAGNLARALDSLLDEAGKIESYAAAAARLGKELLQPWDRRIETEIDLICHLAREDKATPCRSTAL
ncbi:MAG: glycosyltransferase family 4 protein [Alphaproteobacteria bacterium]|nr:glycosyltransferase family 4 protein [Alphaproteobacteria bacterium]MDP6781709.1 glycosyltransferase family 4 protein [Alphaproteobacteria bacterium]